MILMNIFEIERSKRDADFIKQNGELELEVAADIIETYKDVPYVVLSLNLGRFLSTSKTGVLRRNWPNFS